MFPRIGLIIANLETPSRKVVRFYNKRGAAEQWIEEGKQAVKTTRLSCQQFRSNEVRLWLNAIAAIIFALDDYGRWASRLPEASNA